MPKVIKPSNHLRMFCWVSVLTTFSAIQIFGCIDQFFSYAPIPETEEMIGDSVPLVLLLRTCFEQ